MEKQVHYIYLSMAYIMKDDYERWQHDRLFYFLYVVCGRIQERKKVYAIIMTEKEVYR